MWLVYSSWIQQCLYTESLVGKSPEVQKVEVGKSRKDCQRRRERSIVGLMYTVQNDEVMEVQRFDYPEKCQVLPNKRKIPSNNCKLFLMSKIGNR